MAEKEGLKQGRNIVFLTGKVKINDRSFSGVQESKKSDWQYTRINLGVETAEGNVVYTQLMGGYSAGNPVLFAFNKEQGQGMLEINWEDRFNDAILDQVAKNSFYTIEIEKDEKGNAIEKKFLSPIDVEEYLKEHLVDGMEVSIVANFEYQEYQGDTQRNVSIRSIKLPYENKDGEVRYQARFTQTLLVEDNAYKKLTKKDIEEGEITIPANVVQYVGKPIRKNMPFNIGVTAKIDAENPDKTKKVLDKLFKVPKGKVREIAIEGDIIQGYDQENISAEDIEFSPEIQELIDMGLYSEEEAESKMSIRGNKVSKLVFTRPYIQRTDEDGEVKLLVEIDDEKYTPDDLIVVSDTEKDTGSEAQDSSDDEETDESWMTALGL